MDIDGVTTQTDVEVIELINDTNPYPALLEIDWAIDMKEIINLKRRTMNFEKKSLRVVVPLDPAEGECYTKPVCNEETNDELDCIYQIVVQNPGQMHYNDNRRTSWERESICTIDSEEETER